MIPHWNVYSKPGSISMETVFEISVTVDVFGNIDNCVKKAIVVTANFAILIVLPFPPVKINLGSVLRSAK